MASPFPTTSGATALLKVHLYVPNPKILKLKKDIKG